MIRTIKIVLVCVCLLATTATHARLFTQRSYSNGATQIGSKLTSDSKDPEYKLTNIKSTTVSATSEDKETVRETLTESSQSRKGIFATANKPVLKAMGGEGGGFDDGGSIDPDDGFNDIPAGDISWLFLIGLGMAYGVVCKKYNKTKTINY